GCPGRLRMGHLLCTLILLQAAGVLVLMFYALLWEAGNVVSLPEKRIGFYNFCLWNETAGELQCLQYRHLQVMGISLPGIVLARVCVYSCLVFGIFYPLFVAHVNSVWITPFFSAALLLVGLLLFLSQIWNWISVSDLSCAFLALVFSLILQALTAFRCCTVHDKKKKNQVQLLKVYKLVLK
uniref:Transmembrane protein 140 n=1 Tax=Nothoprocta perdicaria TaxID=30464 RepID=A0A8C6ZAN8_NOTPE